MRHVSYSRLRAELASYIEETCANRAPLLVIRQSGAAVVMLALDEYEAMTETLHVLRSPSNAKRLLGSVAAADAGKLVEHVPPRPRRRR
jgi:antitoxin YefM